MAASYPGSLPVKDSAGANLSSNPHSALHDDMYDEIVAIATELGTSPKGTYASVKARLDRIAFGTFSGTTDGANGSLGVTHGLSFTPGAIIVQPSTPNGVSASNRFVSANVSAIGASTFTLGRCVSQDGTLLLGVAVTGWWMAMA